MFFNEPFYIDISKIHLAHEFVLDKAHKCEYPNGRSTYGMVYCIDGAAEYKFNSGKHLSISAGDTLLLSPNAAYSIITKKDFKHYTINFTIHKKNSRLDIIDQPYCLLNNVEPEQFNRYFGKLTKIWAHKNTGYEMLSVSNLYSLVSLFYFEYKNQNTPTDFAARLHPAKEHIDQNFDSAITLELLAKMCSMSVTNFRREWKKIYHSTPMQYRDEVRLSYAKEYLSTGYYSVSEVADKCGFENVGYFISFFEKHTGMSPGAFKKQALML